MRTNVSENSIRVHKQIGKLITDQAHRILSVMHPGHLYTRRELGVKAKIENSSAARAVNGLVADKALVECGTDICRESGYKAGLVRLREAGDPQ